MGRRRVGEKDRAGRGLSSYNGHDGDLVTIFFSAFPLRAMHGPQHPPQGSSMAPPNRRQFLAASATLAAGPMLAPAAEIKPAGIPFKLGLVTYNTAATWDLPSLLEACQTAGIAAVECRTTHKHGVEPSLSPVRRREIKQQFADSGVVFWGSGSVCEFHSPDPAVVRRQIETCKEFIQLVADLGGTGVKVRPNALPKEVPVETTLAQVGKSLIECGTAAAAAGIEIWVEVHGHGTQEPAHMKTIMDHCGHPAVGVTWNSNPTDLKNGSVAEAFELLRPFIKSCHINDLYKDRTGEYPYRELFQLLRQAGYDRYTLIEVGRSQPDLASGIEFLRYYQALWTELARG